MDNWPNIAIALLTYKRTEEAMITINSTINNLDYPKELRRWFIGDDGSPAEHHNALLEFLRTREETLLGESNERLRLPGAEDTYHSGMVWNRALGLCHQFSDYVLWLEDDWRLDEKLDLRPYIKLLSETDGTEDKPKVGIVSFRVLSINNDVRTAGYDGLHYLKYHRTTQYSYSGNPLLRHARFVTHYGWFHEERNPGEIELDYDTRYCADDTGPDIWRPVAINPWGAWVHVGTEKAYK